MSKMSFLDAVVICNRYLECNKHIERCQHNCHECTWDYRDSQLKDAVKVLLKKAMKDVAE